MNRKIIGKAAAVVLIAAAAGVPAFAPGFASMPPVETAITAEAAEHAWMSGNTLTIGTGITRAEIQDFNSRYVIKKITAKSGTVLPKNCNSLFCDLKSLETVDLRNADASNVTNMCCMFYGCTSLTDNSINFGGYTSKVTDMSGMFEGCTSLEEFQLTWFDMSSVETTKRMFTGCSALHSVDMTDLNTSRLDDMAMMFGYCTSLENVYVEGMYTGNVRYMDSLFEKCSSLEELDITSFSAENHPYINSMFSGCSKLETIYVGDNFNSQNLSGSNVFTDCNSLVGGVGTSYDSRYVGSDFARADIPEYGIYGYFTWIGMKDGVYFNPGKHTLYLRGRITKDGVQAYRDNDEVYNVIAMRGCVFPADSSYMFAAMTSGGDKHWNELKTVDISKADTSKVTTMKHMFYDCLALTSINMGGIDTSNVKNMSYMFQSCEKLEHLDISDFDTSSVTSMCTMFALCKKLPSPDLSGFDTSNVTNMSSMFNSCSFEQLDLSGFDTSNVTDMSYMFAHCKWLKQLDLSGFDTSNVSDMEYMFDQCMKLLSLDLSSFDTSNVENMKDMFSECFTLKSLDLSGFDTGNVTDMSNMFSYCGELKSLDLSGFDTGKVTNMTEMFSQCEELESLDLSSFDTRNVTAMSKMFYFCSKLSALDLSGFSTGNVVKMDEMFRYNILLTELDLSSFNTSKVKSMFYMFRNCIALETIKVGSGWNASKVTYSDGMFDNCEALVGGAGTVFDSSKHDKTYARIDRAPSAPGYLTQAQYELNPETGTLTLHGNIDKTGLSKYSKDTRVKKVVAASDCVLPSSCAGLFTYFRYVESIDLSKANPGSVTNVSSMFYACECLKSVDLTGFNTSKCTDFSNMFQQCVKLEKLDISSFNTAKVKNTEKMFWNCKALTKIYVSDKWTMKNVTSSNQMFTYCNTLTGQLGTKVDNGIPDKTYACIDRSGDKGYLSSAAPEFVTNSMTLGGSIALNFYVVPGTVPLEKLEKSTVTFTVNGKDTTVKFNKNKMNSKKTAYGFTCPLNSISMADDVNAKLEYTDAAGKQHTLTTVSTAESYLKKFNSGDEEKLWNIICGINDFGYYMQRYFSETKNWTLGVDHKAMEKAYFTKSEMDDEMGYYLNELSAYKKSSKLSSNIAKINYSLVLDSDTTLNIKVKPASGYTGTVKILLDGQEVQPTKLSDGRLQVSVTGISAHLLAEVHKVEVKTGKNTSTFNACALSYAYDCLAVPGSAPTEPYAMIALYRYYLATIAYKGK